MLQKNIVSAATTTRRGQSYAARQAIWFRDNFKRLQIYGLVSVSSPPASKIAWAISDIGLRMFILAFFINE